MDPPPLTGSPLPHGKKLAAAAFPASRMSGGKIELHMNVKDRRLGIGGTALVTPGTYYGTAVAAKVIPVRQPSDRKARCAEDTMDNELRFLPRLRHKHIVSFLQYIYQPLEGLHVMIMEQLAGTVEDVVLLARRHSMPIAAETVLKIGLHAAQALMYIHDGQILHGDVKTTNLLSTASPEVLEEATSQRGPAVALPAEALVKLGDFGDSLDLSEPTEPLTRGYTPEYLAPEWAPIVDRSRREPLPRHLAPSCPLARDLYALGVVIYELLIPNRSLLSSTIGDRPIWPSATDAGDTCLATMAQLPGVVAIAERLLDEDPTVRPSAELVWWRLLYEHKTRTPPAGERLTTPAPFSGGGGRGRAGGHGRCPARPPMPPSKRLPHEVRYVRGERDWQEHNSPPLVSERPSQPLQSDSSGSGAPWPAAPPWSFSTGWGVGGFTCDERGCGLGNISANAEPGRWPPGPVTSARKVMLHGYGGSSLAADAMPAEGSHNSFIGTATSQATGTSFSSFAAATPVDSTNYSSRDVTAFFNTADVVRGIAPAGTFVLPEASVAVEHYNPAAAAAAPSTWVSPAQNTGAPIIDRDGEASAAIDLGDSAAATNGMARARGEDSLNLATDNRQQVHEAAAAQAALASRPDVAGCLQSTFEANEQLKTATAQAAMAAAAATNTDAIAATAAAASPVGVDMRQPELATTTGVPAWPLLSVEVSTCTGPMTTSPSPDALMDTAPARTGTPRSPASTGHIGKATTDALRQANESTATSAVDVSAAAATMATGGSPFSAVEAPAGRSPTAETVDRGARWAPPAAVGSAGTPPPYTPYLLGRDGSTSSHPSSPRPLKRGVDVAPAGQSKARTLASTASADAARPAVPGSVGGSAAAARGSAHAAAHTTPSGSAGVPLRADNDGHRAAAAAEATTADAPPSSAPISVEKAKLSWRAGQRFDEPSDVASSTATRAEAEVSPPRGASATLRRLPPLPAAPPPLGCMGSPAPPSPNFLFSPVTPLEREMTGKGALSPSPVRTPLLPHPTPPPPSPKGSTPAEPTISLRGLRLPPSPLLRSGWTTRPGSYYRDGSKGCDRECCRGRGNDTTSCSGSGNKVSAQNQVAEDKEASTANELCDRNWRLWLTRNTNLRPTAADAAALRETRTLSAGIRYMLSSPLTEKPPLPSQSWVPPLPPPIYATRMGSPLREVPHWDTENTESLLRAARVPAQSIPMPPSPQTSLPPLPVTGAAMSPRTPQSPEKTVATSLQTSTRQTTRAAASPLRDELQMPETPSSPRPKETAEAASSTTLNLQAPSSHLPADSTEVMASPPLHANQEAETVTRQQAPSPQTTGAAAGTGTSTLPLWMERKRTPPPSPPKATGAIASPLPATCQAQLPSSDSSPPSVPQLRPSARSPSTEVASSAQRSMPKITEKTAVPTQLQPTLLKGTGVTPSLGTTESTSRKDRPPPKDWPPREDRPPPEDRPPREDRPVRDDDRPPLTPSSPLLPSRPAPPPSLPIETVVTSPRLPLPPTAGATASPVRATRLPRVSRPPSLPPPPQCSSPPAEGSGVAASPLTQLTHETAVEPLPSTRQQCATETAATALLEARPVRLPQPSLRPPPLSPWSPSLQDPEAAKGHAAAPPPRARQGQAESPSHHTAPGHMTEADTSGQARTTYSPQPAASMGLAPPTLVRLPTTTSHMPWRGGRNSWTGFIQGRPWSINHPKRAPR